MKVGASLLAKRVGLSASCMRLRTVVRRFASKLAPTLLVLWCVPGLAQAFDLQQLSDQLSRPEVIHGRFIQENTCGPCPSH